MRPNAARANDGAQQDHIEPRAPADTLTPCFTAKMKAEVGVVEKTGRNDGVRVEEFLASTGLGKGNPWCAAFPHWAYRQCGVVLMPKQEFARAAKWHDKGRRVWEKKGWTPDTARSFRPVSEPGDHLALYYQNLGRIGHTAVILREDEKYFYTVEGNTNSEGSREGNGVFLRKRLKKGVYCVSRWRNP